MFDFYKNLTKKPSPKDMALKDLEEARRQILVHQAASKYHTKMTEYYQDTIIRLTAHLSKE
jgi:accessory colonization factor AcfC